MKKENILVFVLIIVAFGGITAYQNGAFNGLSGSRSQTAGQGVSDDPIAWQPFESGVQQAQSQGKHVLVYFYADWCSACKQLKQKTFRDPKVLDFLEKNFISIKINTDYEKDLVAQWTVPGLPTCWFLTPEGEKISYIPGYLPADRFLLLLQYIQSGEYETTSFYDFINRS